MHRIERRQALCITQNLNACRDEAALDGGDAQAGANRGVDRADIVAAEADAPVAPGCIERLRHRPPADAAFGKHGQGERAALRLGWGCGDPDQLFRPDQFQFCHSAAAGDEREVDQPVRQLAFDSDAVVADEIDLNTSMGLGEAPEDLGQQDVGVVIGRADADDSRQIGLPDAAHGLVAQRQDAPGIVEQNLAFARQLDLALAPVEDFLAKRLLQPPDLHADRRLGPMQPVAGAGEALRLDDRDEGLEQFGIDGRPHPRAPASAGASVQGGSAAGETDGFGVDRSSDSARAPLLPGEGLPYQFPSEAFAQSASGAKSIATPLMQ